MNRSDLIRMVSRQIDEPQWVVEKTIDGIVDVIAMAMVSEENVTVAGFGRFESRVKSAAVKPNPRTGEPMEVPKRVTVVFLPSRKLKTRLNSNGSENGEHTQNAEPPENEDFQ